MWQRLKTFIHKEFTKFVTIYTPENMTAVLPLKQQTGLVIN